MKIAIINSLYAPYGFGGAERSVRELAEELVGKGHSVTVLTLGPQGEETLTAEQAAGVNVIRYRSRQIFVPFAGGSSPLGPVKKLAWHAGENFRPGAAQFLRKALREIAPDVVHTNNIAGFGVAAWNAVRSYPLVHTMRDYYLLCSRSMLHRGESNCQVQCKECHLLKTGVDHPKRTPDVFVGISGAVVDTHREMGVISSDAVTAVVSNRPEVAAHPSSRAVGSSEKVVFGLLGRIAPDKGTWVAIEAFKQLPPEVRAASQLRIRGTGKPEAQAKLTAICELDPLIEHSDERINANAFFADVDCALVPSQWREPYGRVAAEAVSLGRYALVSAVGGLPEAAGNQHEHSVADFEDASAWAESMERAFHEIRSGWSADSECTAVQSVASQYEELYERAIREYGIH